MRSDVPSPTGCQVYFTGAFMREGTHVTNEKSTHSGVVSVDGCEPVLASNDCLFAALGEAGVGCV